MDSPGLESNYSSVIRDSLLGTRGKFALNVSQSVEVRPSLLIEILVAVPGLLHPEAVGGRKKTSLSLDKFYREGSCKGKGGIYKTLS